MLFGIWIDCLAVCHQSGAGECKGVLSTLARGIALCSAVLGTLHHGITPWGRRHQKGYLLVLGVMPTADPTPHAPTAWGSTAHNTPHPTWGPTA